MYNLEKSFFILCFSCVHPVLFLRTVLREAYKLWYNVENVLKLG